MDASLSAQALESSQMRSRDGGARGRRAWSRRARPRAFGGLLQCWQPAAAVEAPEAPGARERAPLGRGRRPLWRSSLKAVGSALARVACICEPVCSGVHADALVAPRRRSSSGDDARSGARSPGRAPAPSVSMPAGEWENWRCAFRGTSLNDDVLMRRFVLEEDATRRRMEMQLAANRYGRCWMPPGPSRLSQMSRANDDDIEAGDNSSTSAQCSEDQSL